ncbi:hypothetical protein AALP_AA5G044400 [Arabis alpina]|uniref:Uncharacterized protein n=1 Tax=Arabis alpina TaxID=50452 RepID=A0A087GUW8_ARAAL|nr:hypothetical protein AALP_AA5G044400 [Arabis alpina]
MDPPIPTTATIALTGIEEWELCNDDGFVYKRRKRDDISDVGETSKPPDPELDPVVEERNRRLRKKRILLKLKRKYQREIDQWEIVSNNLNAIQEKSNRSQSTQRQEENTNPNITTSFPESSSSKSMLDELLVMVEAQEAIIQDISNLCEVAENICKMEEEEKKQCFFDLPIWSSPTDLMASLCDSD